MCPADHRLKSARGRRTYREVSAGGAELFNNALRLRFCPNCHPTRDLSPVACWEVRVFRDVRRQRDFQALPPTAKPFASCLLSGGNGQNCAQSEINSALPPQLQRLSQCIAQESQVVQCGRQFAGDAPPILRDVFATMERLKIDEATRLSETPGSIQNILRVVQGIREDKWDQVLIYGGSEVYKIAASLVLSYVVRIRSASRVVSVLGA